jgi:hypothetical protein
MSNQQEDEVFEEIMNDHILKPNNLVDAVPFDGEQLTKNIKFIRMSEEVINDHLFNKGYTLSNFMIRLVHPTTFIPCVATILNPPPMPVSTFYSLPLYVIIDLGLAESLTPEKRLFLEMPEIQKEAEIVNEARDWIIETEKPKIINEARDSIIDDFMKSQSYWQRIKNIFW